MRTVEQRGLPSESTHVVESKPLLIVLTAGAEDKQQDDPCCSSFFFPLLPMCFQEEDSAR